MAFELIYTSVPQGIRPGSSGFCIVAYTNGLAANIALQLEGLSAYKPCFPHYDANADKNPVAFSHYLYNNSGEELHILSRVCFNGLDYTKRSNKLAHHIVMKSGERSGAPSGPSSVFKQQGLFRTFWRGEPQLFPNQLQINAPVLNMHRAETWEAYTGDAGWAGVLVQRFVENPDKPAFIIFDPLKNENIPELVEEALLLLPENMRWKVSFNTYFTTLPAGIRCHWRFCVPGSDALKEARRTPNSLVLDLTKTMPKAPDGELQNIARSGVIPEKKVSNGDSLELFSETSEQVSGEGADQPTSSGGVVNGKIELRSPIPASRQQTRFVPVHPVVQAKSAGRSSYLKIVLLICAVLFFFLCVGGGVFAYFTLKRSLSPSQKDDFQMVSMPKMSTAQTEAPKPVKKTETSVKPEKIPQSPVVHSGKSDKTAESVAAAEAEKKKQEEKRIRETQKRMNDQAEQRKKEEVARKVAENERIRRCDSLWMDSKISDLLKPGGKYEFDILTPGDTVAFVVIKNSKEKQLLVKDGVVSEFDRIVMKNLSVFQYGIKVNGTKVAIENQMPKATPEYPIVELLTKKGKHIYLSFVPGKCKIPEENQAQISITVHPNKNWTAVYEKTALDKEIAKRNPELFANAFIQFNADNMLMKSTPLSKEDKAIVEFSKDSGLVKSYLEICKKIEAVENERKTLEILLKKMEDAPFKKEVLSYYKNLEKLAKDAEKGLESKDYEKLTIALKAEQKKLKKSLEDFQDPKFSGRAKDVPLKTVYTSQLSVCNGKLESIKNIKLYHESQEFAEKIAKGKKLSDLAYEYPLKFLFATKKLKDQGIECRPAIQFNKPLTPTETLNQVCGQLENKKKKILDNLKKTPMHIMTGNDELKTVRKIKVEVK